MSRSHRSNHRDPDAPASNDPHRTRPPARTPAGRPDAETTVRKVCAYLTRNDRELLVFDGPGHDDLQIPKGTIEGQEPPREALRREVREESGLQPDADPTHLASDIWTRRHHPPRRYLRHFYHLPVDEPRDNWTHVVDGDGAERGLEFEFTWLPIRDARGLALDLDDYVPLLLDRL
jgi:8-oxo-dGTP pyrophosphatase MutT (NUDIX family)